MTQDNIYSNLIEAVEERAQCRVAESINFKLNVGDTFSCGCFINNYPLYLNRLLHGDMTPTSYVCGKEGGIKYEIRRCNESKSGG